MASNLSRSDEIKEKFKQAFLSWQYQSLNVIEIDKQFLSITSTKPSRVHANTVIKNQLNSQDFWQKLEEENSFSKEVEDLKTQWKQVCLFADFSSQELMQLKRDKFDVYELAILRALQELQSDLQRYKLHNAWRPAWMLTWHQAKIDELNNKYQIFLSLKKQLQSSLLLKTHLVLYLGTPKRVDDLYLYFAEKTNKLSRSRTKLAVPINISSALDDDTRTAIFDYLSTDSAIKISDLERIIEPISQTPYKVPIKPAQVKNELENIAKFSSLIEIDLQLTSTSKFKKEKQEKDKTESWLRAKFSPLFSQYIFSTTFSKNLFRIWRYRWFLAFVVTFGTYLWLAPTIITFVGLSVGGWAAQLVLDFLFYGIALFPIYVVGIKAINSIGKFLHEKMSYWKTQEIQQSLEILKLNQRFISSQLSSGIMDVAFFNIASLELSAQTVLKNIDNMIKTLERTKGLSRLVYWGQLKRSNEVVLKELKSQRCLIDARLKTYATHISERLSESLANLHKDICDSKLKPVIPKLQINHLNNFVKKYGSFEDQKKFSQSARLTSLFSAALLSNTLRCRTNFKTQLNQPWGGFKSNIPSFNGWRTLIEHYVLDDHKRNAALNIIDVLTGQKHCTIVELSAWVSEVAEEENRRQLMRNIQQHIFLTLDERPSKHAQLLSIEQKNLVVIWGKENLRKIRAARSFVGKLSQLKNIQSILARIPDNALIEHFEALEGLERFDTVRGEKNSNQNIVRKMLEQYDGSASRLTYFLKFLPPHLKESYSFRMATLRLKWLMANLKAINKNIFDEADVELFKYPALSDNFSFEKIVRDSKQYNQPWSEIFDGFLQQCTQNGFDDGDLFSDYAAMNERVKDFLEKNAKVVAPALKNHTKKKKLNTEKKTNLSTKAVPGVRCA
ncbi:hypothetical protein CC99x_012840 [Candidatus Berkiella cookevillensis]|uniref:Uncharacterized protein n=1 Tax=Candidatus Berkiella cookevillensis TaxID=437022 RepID=A0A0Q9YKE3_9GAMM|nr:hypothetical protein [Candidatus Berkiella cookevillensis]MCS5709786.1 hypothetical protein [Candidatus Berkiella cookevillensis]